MHASFSRKWSTYLGEKWTKGIPIEVLPIAYRISKQEIEKQLGGEAVVREGTGKMVGQILLDRSYSYMFHFQGPVLTDQGNFIIDWKFPLTNNIDWSSINQKLKMIPGTNILV
jgi:ribose 5-phosphate isomerase A